jgi:hypothetical protein
MLQVLQISKEHVRARALLHKARQYKDKKEQGARYKYRNQGVSPSPIPPDLFLYVTLSRHYGTPFFVCIQRIIHLFIAIEVGLEFENNNFIGIA